VDILPADKRKPFIYISLDFIERSSVFDMQRISISLMV